MGLSVRVWLFGLDWKWCLRLVCDCWLINWLCVLLCETKSCCRLLFDEFGDSFFFVNCYAGFFDLQVMSEYCVLRFWPCW